MTDRALARASGFDARELFDTDPNALAVRSQDLTAVPQVEPQRPFSFEIRGSGLNRVTDASAGLIALMLRIATLGHLDDIDTLHRRSTIEIESIELELHRLGYDRVSVLALRYCLCSAFDEAVMNSPWGLETNWSERSLLATFHNETWGGEKFFVILARLMTEPNRYIDLLEFLYLCLNLGYEGRYRAMHNGRVQLEAVIKELHDVIRTERGPTEPLSLFKSEGIVQKAHRVAWQTPISLVVIAAFATAVLLYLTFFLLTRSEATRSLEQLNQIIGR